MDDFDKKIQTLINDNMNITNEGKILIDNTLRNLKMQTPNRTLFPIFNKISRIATIGILAASAVSVCAYTGGKIYEKLQEKNITSNVSKITSTYAEIEAQMQSSHNGWYYKIISNYDEYIEFKNKNYGEILDMSEEDFNQNFLMILYSHILGHDSMYVYDINNKNDTLEIIVRKNELEKRNSNRDLISVKINNELYSENIKITNAPILSKSNEIVDVLELPFNYTKEQAVQDGYVVLDHQKLISNDPNAIDNFINETEEGKENHIRIVWFDNFSNASYAVYDIYFQNGIYEVALTGIGFTEPGNNLTDLKENDNIYTEFLNFKKFTRSESDNYITYMYADGLVLFSVKK